MSRNPNEHCKAVKNLPWTQDEDCAVLKYFPDWKAIQNQIPHRTRSSIRMRWRRLGLKRAAPKWTNTEIRLLQRVFAGTIDNDLMEHFPHRTIPAVSQKVHALGLERIPHPYFKPKITGNAIVDNIRQRAWEDGIPIRCLEAEIDSGWYFRQFISRRKLHWDQIAKAVEFFGGRLVIDWQDE